jgi:hypothetical protein
LKHTGILLSLLILAGLLISGSSAQAQLMNHYWSVNFNSQSSLLSGAVVAGDGGNTSMYYNPATISDMEKGSNLSFSTSLLTWNVSLFTNALGNNTDIINISFNVQPQFLSFSSRPHKSKFAYAFTTLVRMKDKIDISYYNSTEIDIIKSTPGPENYNVAYKYFLEYNDNWVGMASSYDVNDRFRIGASLFVSVAYVSYKNSLNLYAFSTKDTLWVDNVPNPSLVSKAIYSNDFKFVDYRLILKLGFSYVLENWKFGLNFTSGSFSLFSTKKEARRVEEVANITNEANNEFMPGYVITNGQILNDITTRIKYPFSISYGLIHRLKNSHNKIYFTMEYFHGIQPYKMISAPIKDDITSDIVYDNLENKDWLSVANTAKPVLNIAVGYRWVLKENIMFLNGFRTDFNNISGADYKNLASYNTINTNNINIYHYTSGFQFFFLKKYLLIIGGELSYGREKNQQQLANFSDPVEYDPSTNTILQGTIQNNMDVYSLGFNIYFGLSFKFGEKNKD